MQFPISLFFASAIVLVAGKPSPAETAPRFKCTSLATTGGGSTPSVQVGILNVPTVPIPGTNTGANKVLVCCKQPVGGAGGLPNASCADGYITTDSTCPNGRALCCGSAAAPDTDIGPVQGVFSLCEPATPA